MLSFAGLAGGYALVVLVGWVWHRRRTAGSANPPGTAQDRVLDHDPDDPDDGSAINPANGAPMVGGGMGMDVLGYAAGTDSNFGSDTGAADDGGTAGATSDHDYSGGLDLGASSSIGYGD